MSLEELEFGESVALIAVLERFQCLHVRYDRVPYLLCHWRAPADLRFNEAI